MAFAPKFVDLVRNLTTSTGTGPVILGTAVTGYSSIAQSLSSGDQFYYCIQGVDKPAEREVGRGTLMANGTVAREAIGGPLTNFTTGTKTIALVTAAEWFAKLESAGAASSATSGSGAMEVASRTALAAITGQSAKASRYLAEAGREGMFVWNPANLSSMVASDTRQGMSVAPASDPTGASGAWVRKFDGSAFVEWFGAVGNDQGLAGTNDGPAIAAAITTLKAISESVPDALYTGSCRLRFAAKAYYLGTTTLEINHTFIIEGEGTGLDGGIPTRLRWATDTTGIRVHRYNTVGATGSNAGGQQAGDGAIIRGLFLLGDFASTATEKEAHGIDLRARATIEDVYVYRFEGDGIFISTAGRVGNANCFALNRVSANSCRNGVFVDGADANAGIGTMVNAMGNRAWGICDGSFLGNSWVSCHTADNGFYAPKASIVSHSGNYYFVKLGQEAWASVNAPSGTTDDNLGWYYLSAGTPDSIRPAWSSGMTVRAGGPFCATDVTARALFTGCYYEFAQAWPQLHGNSMNLFGFVDGVKGPTMQVYNGTLHVPELRTTEGLTASGAANFNTRLWLRGGAPFRMYNAAESAYYYAFMVGTSLYEDLAGGGSRVLRMPVIVQPDGGTTVFDIDTNGANLAAGKVLKVGGNQVVGARGAAVADATDAASAITQLNAALARLRAHGLIAT